MANKVKVVTVSERDRAELERRVGAKSASARSVERAQIMLLSADG